ncbi:MAG: hypothetical protein II942_05285 [Alphaproteobacteria bacterium]|nr:hypothetical protein [Alphaproteobacteria bacterium]
MIEISRKWNDKGRLEGARICTSGGYDVNVTWDKKGEATVVYGQIGKKHRRLVGLPSDGLEFGDSIRNHRNFFNGFIIKGQSVIKKCQASLILDGKEMPSDQMVFDLNRSYMSREEKRIVDSVMSGIETTDEKQSELRKLALVGRLFNLSQEEAKQVVVFATHLKQTKTSCQ